MLLISVGMLALLAGSGAAALYVGADSSDGEKPQSAIGGECFTIQTMVLKTPSRRLWMRKFIRMESMDGAMRIKTALRVAGLLAKANPVDLVQVSVLDAKGPTLRSEMRGRAIGAEVVIGLQPKHLPGMKEPFIVRFYEGAPSAEGRYYGERVSLELKEIQKLMGAMKSAPDKHDCAEPEKPADAAAADHGKKPKDGAVVKQAEHGEKPEDPGEKPAEHGNADAPVESGDEAAPAEHGAAPENAETKPEPSFVDGMLSMVGLGGDEQAASPDAPSGHESPSAEAATDDAGAAEHGATPAKQESQTAPAAEPSYLDSALGLIGLGGDTPPAEHDAPAEDEASAPVANGREPAEAKQSEPDAAAVDGEHNPAEPVQAEETHRPAEAHAASTDAEALDDVDLTPAPAAETHVEAVMETKDAEPAHATESKTEHESTPAH